MLHIFSPIFFSGIASLFGGYIFSLEDGASMSEVCEGAGLYGGILAAFFIGIQHVA